MKMEKKKIHKRQHRNIKAHKRLLSATNASKMGNLEEMDKFLEKYNFLKLNQEGKENLKRPITSMETETVIRNLPANKSPGPDSFTTEFYQKIYRRANTYLIQTLPENCRRR